MLDNFCLEFTKFLKKYPIQSCALVLVVCFLLGDKFEKKFAAVGSVGSVFIGYGAYRISKEQQRATEQKISDEQRKVILQNYLKLTNAISLLIRHGEITNESLRTIYEVKDEIEIMFAEDDELTKFITEFKDMAYQSWIAKLGAEESEGRTKKGDEEVKKRAKTRRKFREFILYNTSDIKKIYAKYLKLPNPKP